RLRIAALLPQQEADLAMRLRELGVEARGALVGGERVADVAGIAAGRACDLPQDEIPSCALAAPREVARDRRAGDVDAPARHLEQRILEEDRSDGVAEGARVRRRRAGSRRSIRLAGARRRRRPRPRGGERAVAREALVEARVGREEERALVGVARGLLQALEDDRAVARVVAGRAQ